MAKADNRPRYAAMQHDKTGERAVWLILHPDSLCIVDGEDMQFWPLSDVYAGQIGQGEAECIGISTHPDLRLFVARDVLTAVKAAIRGEPYILPRPWRISVGPVLLFGFLGLCALIRYFFD